MATLWEITFSICYELYGVGPHLEEDSTGHAKLFNGMCEVSDPRRVRVITAVQALSFVEVFGVMANLGYFYIFDLHTYMHLGRIVNSLYL